MPNGDANRKLVRDVSICLRRVIQLIDIDSQYLVKTVGLSVPLLIISNEVDRKG